MEEWEELRMLAAGYAARAPAAGGRRSERADVNRERLSTHEALAIRARSLTPPRACRAAREQWQACGRKPFRVSPPLPPSSPFLL